MRCADLTDDQLWRAIAQNTETLAAIIHQQLEFNDADCASIHPRVRADLIGFARKFQREYRQYTDELRRRHPIANFPATEEKTAKIVPGPSHIESEIYC